MKALEFAEISQKNHPLLEPRTLIEGIPAAVMLKSRLPAAAVSPIAWLLLRIVLGDAAPLSEESYVVHDYAVAQQLLNRKSPVSWTLHVFQLRHDETVIFHQVVGIREGEDFRIYELENGRALVEANPKEDGVLDFYEVATTQVLGN